jgi:hypothetical protein
MVCIYESLFSLAGTLPENITPGAQSKPAQAPATVARKNKGTESTLPTRHPVDA